jgi:zinc transport system substrate-binding protein
MILSRTLVPFIAACSATVLAAGCTTDSESNDAGSVDGPLAVVASFYPLQWMAEEVGGDAVNVTSLTPEGVEPHDLAVDAGGLRALDAASAVIYLGADFQPDVEKAIAGRDDGSKAVDLLQVEGVNLIAAGDIGKETLSGGEDPHVWLDPVRMQVMVDGVVGALADAAPDRAQDFTERGEVLKDELGALHEAYRTSLVDCESTLLVTSHAAFGYLADQYGLTQVPIAGVSPEDTPDAKTLTGIAATARESGVSTVFFEDALPDDLARTVADEIGAEIDLLAALEFDPRGSISEDSTYLSVMDSNREAIARGLRCSK